MSIGINYRPPRWDSRVTICKDERRLGYCAKQLIRVTRAGTAPHKHARAVLYQLNRGVVPAQESAYMLERLYRQYVLQQVVTPNQFD